MVQQYRGSAIDISYSKASLREIFLNNIRREKEKNLCAPGQLRGDPLDGVRRPHHASRTAYTGEVEDVFDYVYRHTLQRPRDLMTLGQTLSNLPPEERAQRGAAQGGGEPAAPPRSRRST